MTPDVVRPRPPGPPARAGAPGEVVDPFDVPGGWRLGGPAWTTWRFTSGHGQALQVRTRGRAGAADVEVGSAPPTPARAARDGDVLSMTFGDRTRHYTIAEAGTTIWLARDGLTWVLHEHEHLATSRGDDAAAGLSGDVVLRSPMPGTVVLVPAAAGEEVAAGQPLVVVEAMKMEHTLAAPVAGVVTEVPVRPGQPVAMDEVVAVVKPLGQDVEP